MVSTQDTVVGDGDILRGAVPQGKQRHGESRAQLAFHTAVSTLFLLSRLTEDSLLDCSLHLSVNDEGYSNTVKTYRVHGED